MILGARSLKCVWKRRKDTGRNPGYLVEGGPKIIVKEYANSEGSNLP
jgi:hypothetical protein